MEMKQRLNKENTTQPTDQHLGPSRNSLKRNITIGRMLSLIHTQQHKYRESHDSNVSS